jgi:hypothetical protein
MITCPKCGRGPVKCLFRSAVRPTEDEFHCNDCGHQFKRYDEPIERENLSARQTTQILAALRFWQSNFEDEELHELEGEGHFEVWKPMKAEEIDKLCEELNCSDVLLVSKPVEEADVG